MTEARRCQAAACVPSGLRGLWRAPYLALKCQALRLCPFGTEPNEDGRILLLRDQAIFSPLFRDRELPRSSPSRRDTGIKPGVLTPGTRCCRVRSAQQIPLVIRNLVLLEERDQLILERDLPMMFLLGPNICADSLHKRLADRERAVSLLPIEALTSSGQIVHPLRGLALDLLDHLRHGDARLELGEEVDVVGNAANL